jgi:hypothetical protein
MTACSSKFPIDRLAIPLYIVGGFDDRVFEQEDAMAIKREVDRCLEAAAGNGGYILRPAGQLIHARRQDIETMCSRAHTLGRYPRY